MSEIKPDLEGFAAAQAALRGNFGRDVRFYGHAAMIYDPALPASEFDDEGIPLDPLAGASAVASANVSIANTTVVGSAHCNVVFRPLQTSIMRRDQTFETPMGIQSALNKDLLLDPADYHQASGAVYFQVGTFTRDADGNILYNPDGSEQQFTPEEDELWKIVNLKRDSFASVERVVVYGEGTL